MRSLSIAATGMLAQQLNVEVISNNIANMNTVYNSSTFHTNSVHYYPSDNTYTLGDRNPNLYVKVSRTGQLIWQFGGTNPKDATKNFTGITTWMVNHGHHMLADGSFMLFNNGSMMGGASTARVCASARRRAGAASAASSTCRCSRCWRWRHG